MSFEEIIQKNSKELHIPPDIYSKIVKSSFEQSEQDINDFEKAINENDYDAMKMLAHRLKGVYLNLRLDEISVPAEEADALAKGEGDIEKIRLFFNQLKEAFKNVKSHF